MKCWVTLVVSAAKARALTEEKPEHRHWPTEEDMQAAVSEKIDNMIADGELPPNWRGRKKLRR